jgi:hypothetical protein
VRAKALGLVATLALWAGSASAQLTTLAPSATAACLTPPVAERGEPEYPTMLYKSGKAGRVVAAATFEGTDFFPTPTIKIEAQEGSDEFVDAVKKHLRSLRVPCLPRDGKATLRFEFVFDPNSPRVFWADPVDTADSERQALLKCVVGIKDNKPPSYPLEAKRFALQGRVWATARYLAPDQPPEVKLHFRPNAQQLANEVEDWLRQRRMPCLQTEPIEAEMIFIFRLGGDVYGFKPLSLLQYMGKVKDLARQRVQFDTQTMGCPFDLKLQYRQPDAPNKLGQAATSNPARRPLLDWLAASQLDLHGAGLDSVYADTADIHVPCVKIDLQPKVAVDANR